MPERKGGREGGKEGKVEVGKETTTPCPPVYISY